MTTTSSLDHWRGVFRDSDIFHVIREAIRVAASDHPDELMSRRDKIAQMLFAEPHRRVEKADEGCGNAVKAIEDKEDSGRGNGEQKPAEPAVVAVDDDEEKTDNEMRRETWKIVSVSKTGKIRLRRFLHDQMKPSDPHRSSIEHQPAEIAPSTDNKPAAAAAQLDDASLRSKLEMSKRKLREGYQQTENAKRQRRIQVIQPRAEIPKDCNKKPPLFKNLGTWLR